MMPRILFVLMILLPFAACAQQTSSGDPGASVSSPVMPAITDKGDAVPMPMPAQDLSCVKPFDLVGQPGTVLHKMKFKNVIRVLAPGMAATMDYSPQRTNFILDKQGIIREIHCG